MGCTRSIAVLLIPSLQNSYSVKCLKHHRCLLCRDASGNKLVEIVADKSRPLVLRFSDNTAEQLPLFIDLDAALAKLRIAADCGKETVSILTHGITCTTLVTDSQTLGRCWRGKLDLKQEVAGKVCGNSLTVVLEVFKQLTRQLPSNACST